MNCKTFSKNPCIKEKATTKSILTWCGNCSSDSKNRQHTKYEHLIPLVQCGSNAEFENCSIMEWIMLLPRRAFLFPMCLIIAVITAAPLSHHWYGIIPWSGFWCARTEYLYDHVQNNIWYIHANTPSHRQTHTNVHTHMHSCTHTWAHTWW